MSEDLTDAPVSDEESADRRKKLVLGGGVAVVILLGGYLLLGTGGSDDDLDVGAPVARTPRVAASVAPEAVKLPAAYKEQIGRNPFLALYSAPVAAPAAPAPAVDPVAPVVVPVGTTSGAGPVAPAPAPVTQRYPLKLISITSNGEVRTTTWTVDGKKVTVLPAQRFGKYGELVVLAFTKNDKGVVDTAILQVGDDTPIEVAVGETNTVM